MINQNSKYVVFCLLCFHIFLFLPYTIDDAFIIFKYARNLINGLGYVYDEGERINASSSFLWTFLLAPSELFSEGSIFASKLLGIIFLVGTILIGFRIFELLGEKSFGTKLLFIALISFNSSIINWSVYGLENALYSFLIISFVFYFLKETAQLLSKRNHLFFLLLIMITRPEGFIFIPAYFILILIYHKFISKVNFRYILLNTLIIFFFLTAFFTIQKLYFGYFLPNTVYAKVQLDSIDKIFSGINYLFSKINLANLFIIISSVFLATHLLLKLEIERKYKFQILVISLVGFIYPIFSVLVGGDWMPNNRFITYSLNLNILLISLFYSFYKTNTKIKFKYMSIIGLILYFTFNSYLTFTSVKFQNKLDHATKRACKDAAVYLNKLSNADSKFAASDIGMIGYYYKGKILDWWGLADDYLAHSGQAMGNLNWDYILMKNPDFIYLYSEYPDQIKFSTKYKSSKSIITNKLFLIRYEHLKSFYFSEDRYHLIYRKKY